MDSYQITLAGVNILAVILSPIIALWVSDKIQDKKNIRNDKMWILKTLMVQRATINDTNYVNALNLIDLIFVNSSDVRKAYKALYNEYLKRGDNFDPDKIHRARTKLLETIVNDLGYKDKITWDDIQEPYVPMWLIDEINKRNKIIDAHTNVANIINSLSSNSNSNVVNNQGNDVR